MRGPDRGRLHGLLVSTSALAAMLLVAVLIPATSSAFTALITNTTDTAVSKTRFVCADTFAGDRRRSAAYFEFGLTEAADSTVAVDSSSSNNPGTYRGSNAKDGGSPTACPNDAGAAYLLDGSTSRVTTSRQYSAIAGNFSEEAWFKTSSTGKILGFELGSTDDRSSNYDKHLYVGSSGELVYGIYNGSIQTLRTPGSVADGAWHYAVATTSDSGSKLYLDGVRVDSNPNYVTAESFNGYWRIGWGNLDSWPDAPGGANWFSGSIRFAAAYPYVLTADEVASAWSIGKPGAAADTTKTARATATPAATPDTTSTPAATDSPAPASSATPEATPTARPVKSGSTPIYQPAPDPTEGTAAPVTQ